MAADVGISASLLSLIESGRREPTLQVLRKLSRELGVASGVLFAAALVTEGGGVDNGMRQVVAHLLNAAQMQMLADSAFFPKGSRAEPRISRARKPAPKKT